MNTMQNVDVFAEKGLSEEARIEDMAWKIYDILFRKDGSGTRSTRSRKPSPSTHDVYESPKGQVEDLYDMLNLEA